MFCYVTNPKSGSKLPHTLNLGNTLFYPEKYMTIEEQATSGRPKDFHIVTNSPDLVGLYSTHEVHVWDKSKKKWVNPSFQTYGACLTVIRSEIFGINASIPQACISNELVTNIMGHPLDKKR